MGEYTLETKVLSAIQALEPLQVLDDAAAFTGAQVAGPASMAEDALRSQRARIAQLEAVAEAAEAVAERLESDDDLEDGAADGVTVRQVLARDLRVRLAALRDGGDDGSD